MFTEFTDPPRLTKTEDTVPRRRHDDLPPTDCVREFPVVGENVVELAAFCSLGKVRMKVRVHPEHKAEIEAWMLDWVRLNYGSQKLQIMR